jgi:GAF domain-containing protein
VSDAPAQLRVLAEVSRSLARFTNLDELVHYATRRTRELFEAEGCAVLLLDGKRNEFCFPVASQRDCSAVTAAELAEVRFPAAQGVAGWVLTHDEGALVADTAKDPRFSSAVDRRTTMHTRALLCAPLRTHEGNIGVLEVVNPSAAHLDADHLEFLEILANEIGVAYATADLYRQLEREVIDLRRFCRVLGVGLALLGLVLCGGAVLYHRIRVLPWSELLTQRGMLLGLVSVGIGVVLVSVGKGWVVSMGGRGQAGAP